MTHPINAKWVAIICVLLVMSLGVAIVAAHLLAPAFFGGWTF
ncbi:MAG TPA: hypothetical protein VES67_26255 [Vicinamibacterales bacterium]|nr:hypothetical protein [Vicinamibacterales bacterium]